MPGTFFVIQQKAMQVVRYHGLNFGDLDSFDWEGAYFEETKPSRRSGRRFKAVGQFDGERR